MGGQFQRKSPCNSTRNQLRGSWSPAKRAGLNERKIKRGDEMKYTIETIKKMYPNNKVLKVECETPTIDVLFKDEKSAKQCELEHNAVSYHCEHDEHWVSFIADYDPSHDKFADNYDPETDSMK